MFAARCMLFTPANKPERFAKAEALGADGVIIDLEDAISFQEKDSAREQVVSYFKGLKKNKDSQFIHAIRINSAKTREGLKDLIALTDNNILPDLLVLPKAESMDEVEMVNKVLSPTNIPLLPLIETAEGLKNAHGIAKANHTRGLVFGGADMAADLGATMTWEPMLTARSIIVQAAASAGIAAIDVPYLILDEVDNKGVIEETKRVKALGFTCKLAIHPKHIAPIKQTLSPTPEELRKAKRIVEAYEAAHGNASTIDGKMIDVPVYRSAKRALVTARIDHHDRIE